MAVPAGLPHASLLLAGDVDADLDQDLIFVAALTESLRILRNDGTGRFTLDAAATPSLGSRLGLAVELNGDRAIDLVLSTANNVKVLLNGGQGGFTATNLPGISTASALAAADINGDGDLDLIATSQTWTAPLHLFENVALGTFAGANRLLPAPRALVAHSVAAFDADGDRDVDLAVATSGFQSELLLNNGGVFMRASTPRLPLVSNVDRLFAADVDGDGAVDLLANAAGRGEIWKNVAGVFEAIDPPVVPPEATLFADLNGDGDPDAIGSTYDPTSGTSAQLFTARNDGSGRCMTDQVLAMPAPVILALAGDLDADGDLDVVVYTDEQGLTPATWRALVNDGRGGLIPGATFVMSISTYTSGSLIDLDRDGDTDVLLGNGSALEVAPTGFVLRPLAGVSAAHSKASAADIDGDGLPEILLADRAEVRLFGNRGAFRFVDSSAIIADPLSVATAVVAGRDASGQRTLCSAGLGAVAVHTFDGARFQRTATGTWREAQRSSACKLPTSSAIEQTSSSWEHSRRFRPTRSSSTTRWLT